MYNFEDGYFKNPKPSNIIGANIYAISNSYEQKQALTFGLAQGVNVINEAFPNKPINAMPVPSGQSAQITPVEKIDVYLMCNIDTSTVVSKIYSPVLIVTYNDDESENSIEYNANIGKFFLK